MSAKAQRHAQRTSVMGKILGVPGRAAPHIFQILPLDGLPRMTLSARPALAICLAASLIRPCAAGTRAAR